MENLTPELIVAVIAVGLIQYLKKASWFPGVMEGNSKLNAAFALLVAAASATGIAFASTFDASAGVLTITVAGLTKSSVMAGLWAWAKQWVFQQIGWKALKGINALDVLKAAMPNKEKLT